MKPLPCPFCGSRKQPSVGFCKKGVFLRCDACAAAGPDAKDEPEALRLWNERKRETAGKAG